MKKTIARSLTFLSSVFAGAVMFTTTASAQCDLLPIALPAATLASVDPGTVITNISSGARAANFNWLTWTGAQRDSALVNSLTGNGDSGTYINPFNGENEAIGVDSWIVSQEEVYNSRPMHRALNNLLGDVITVPVYDDTEKIRVGPRRNQHTLTLYHVVGFAQVQILDYRLRGERDHLTVLFLDFVSCNSGPMD